MTLPKYYEGIIKHQAQSVEWIFSLLPWCNWIKVFKKVFCNIWPLLEHCHEFGAGKSSFSLFSYFFTAHEDFFPSSSVPVLALDPIVGGYWLQWCRNVREHPAQWSSPRAVLSAGAERSQGTGGIWQLCIQPARTGCLGRVCWGTVTGRETLQRMSHSRLEDVC